ncbi:MAG: phosphoenolpyruvate carboxylase, partial [Bacteroidota bacterium]
MTIETLKLAGLEKIRTDFAYLIARFKEMLQSLGEEALAAALPDGPEPPLTDPHKVADEKLAQAIGISFELLNLVEENTATHFRRKIETEFGLEATRGSWGETLKQWKEAGISEEAIAELLPNVQVMPVLTAHPTEAKRVTVLDIHRDLYMLLVKKENPRWSPNEQAEIEQEIITLLERWWRTGEIYLEKPSLTDERNNLMHYFVNVFPEALRLTDQRLRDAWRDAGFREEWLQWPEHFPMLHFGSWVGGDRDGHPFVTPEFTSETLALHRQAAIEMIREALYELAANFSFSSYMNAIPENFLMEIQVRAELLGEAGKAAVERNPSEPLRQYLNLILARLSNAQGGGTDWLEGQTYQRADELAADLKRLRDLLLDLKADRIAQKWLFPVERMVACFGFYLAKLDIR